MKVKVEITNLMRYTAPIVFVTSNPKTIKEYKVRAKSCGTLCNIKIKEIKI